MDFEVEEIPGFCCIGLEAEGALESLREWIPRLWCELHRRDAEIAHLAPGPFWGLASDTRIHLAPWGGDRGRYLASRQVAVGTEPFGDWKVWEVPPMGWVCIPCHPEEIPSCIEAVRGFQRNNLLWRWAGSVHEVYPEDFRDPSRDLLHLMVGLLPR